MAGPVRIGQVMHVKEDGGQMKMGIDAHRTVWMLEEESPSMMAPVDGKSVLRSDALDDGRKGLVCDLNEQVRFLRRPRERMDTNAMPRYRTRDDRLERSTIRVIKENQAARVAAKDDVVSRACDVVVLRSYHP
jgi:hypothetical protein